MKEPNFVKNKEIINDFIKMNRDNFLKKHNYLTIEEIDNTISTIEDNIENLYFNFTKDGRSLCAYDLSNTFNGELESTLADLSYEEDCSMDEIKIEIIDSEEYEKLTEKEEDYVR